MVLKYEIPANPSDLVILINFIFSFETPPKAIIFLFVSLDTKLYLLMPKKLLFFLNIEDKKIIALGGVSKKNMKLISLTKSEGFAGISFFKTKKKGP